MKSEVLTQLTPELMQYLSSQKLVILTTIDAESGGPVTSAISWVYAPDERTVRFAVDARSRIVGNVRANPKVNAAVFAEGSLRAIYGTASIVQEKMEGVPFPLVCIDIAVESVRDAMFYGAKITVEPEYVKTYDQRAAEKLDNQVFAAMKKA